MPIQVNITSIVGTQPFSIWVCDSDETNNTCLYIDYTVDSNYSFELPIEFETANGYCVKVIDSEGCVSYVCFGGAVTPSPTPSVTPSITPRS